jgi:hypothetical protein
MQKEEVDEGANVQVVAVVAVVATKFDEVELTVIGSAMEQFPSDTIHSEIVP